MTDQIVRAYHAAPHRLLVFDYDGVLAPIVDRPEDAHPSEEVRSLLRMLSSDQHTKLIVVSGRDQATLENWLGDIPIDMSAEHGLFRKVSGEWQATSEANTSWRTDVEAAMKRLVATYPGSHIETKQASLVWHYRLGQQRVDNVDAMKQIVSAAKDRAVVMPGKSVIDVRAPGTDKGTAVRYWYDSSTWDFELCIGDDVTDEAMFVALPDTAWTIKVGEGPTRARAIYRQQSEVIALLRKITSL